MQRSEDGKASSSSQDGEAGGWRLRIRKVIRVVSAQKRVLRSRDELKKSSEVGSASSATTTAPKGPHDVLEVRQKSAKDLVQETFQKERSFTVGSQGESTVKIRRDSKTTYIDVKIDGLIDPKAKGRSEEFVKENVKHNPKEVIVNVSSSASPLNLEERAEETADDFKVPNGNDERIDENDKKSSIDEYRAQESPNTQEISPLEIRSQGSKTSETFSALTKITEVITNKNTFYEDQDGTLTSLEEILKATNESQNTSIIITDPFVSAANRNRNSELSGIQDKLFKFSEEALKRGNECVGTAEKDQSTISSEFETETNNINSEYFDGQERPVRSYGLANTDNNCQEMMKEDNSLITSKDIEEDLIREGNESQRMLMTEGCKLSGEEDDIRSISEEELLSGLSNNVGGESLATRKGTKVLAEEDNSTGNSQFEDTRGLKFEFQKDVKEHSLAHGLYEDVLPDNRPLCNAESIEDTPVSFGPQEESRIVTKNLNKNVLGTLKDFLQDENFNNSRKMSKSKTVVHLTENKRLNLENKNDVHNNNSMDFDEEYVFWEPTFSHVNAESNGTLQDVSDKELFWTKKYVEVQDALPSRSSQDGGKLTRDGLQKSSSGLFSSPSLSDLPSEPGQMYFGPGHLEFKWSPLP